MKHSDTLLNGTKTTSYLNRFYKKVVFWLWFPFLWIAVKFKNKFRDVEKLRLFGIKWENIDKMPIHNWIKILETADLNYLFISEGIVVSKTEDHWLNLQQEYIDEFGLDKTYKQKLRLMEQLKNFNNEFVLTRDRFILNLIKICEADIKMLDTDRAIKFYEMVDHAEKYKGFRIDPKKISVKSWYYTLKNMSSGN